MKYYVIKNGDYYLSNHYEPAAEALLGYGGVYSKTDIKKFVTLRQAQTELKIIRVKTGNKSATIEEVDVK